MRLIASSLGSHRSTQQWKQPTQTLTEAAAESKPHPGRCHRFFRLSSLTSMYGWDKAVLLPHKRSEHPPKYITQLVCPYYVWHTVYRLRCVYAYEQCFFSMYPALYTGSMPTRIPPHAYADGKGRLRPRFLILGAYAGASAGFFVGWPCSW